LRKQNYFKKLFVELKLAIPNLVIAAEQEK